MARGGHSPSPAIPKVSYMKVEDEASTLPAGVHDQQARSYGYNDFSHFTRPEHYIRHVEPEDEDLAVQVEYDMDEQDQEWLDTVNNERKAEQLNKVSYEAFEIIMDRLEKEWFDLTKNLPKSDLALPSEDSTCAICDDSEGVNSNAIVFCDGCNLAVHQDCYGVPYIPEGQWLCRKCTVSPENPVSCILCPNEGGAFKQTVNGEWAHLLCAIWVPETRVANDVFMEPITGVDKINKQRWKLRCSICGIRGGACVQCSKTSCFLAFHATCARKQRLLMPMKAADGAETATLACYCEKHLPKEQQAAHEAALAELEAADPNSSFEYDDSSSLQTPRATKKARAYAKTYKLGPPLVPAIVVRRIMEYIAKVSIRKKLDFVQLVCRYWSLKREARRGAPLLKRLHLEPWTAGAVGKVLTDEEMAMKLQFLKELRKDLENVRMLAELTRKREMQKLKQAQIINEIVSNVVFPFTAELRLAFERIMALDRHEFFKNPVSKTDVPDYFDIIKKPMCWKVIDEKLDKNMYARLKNFEQDIYLVLDNAMTYNKSDSPIYRTASRIKAQATHFLQELQQTVRHIPEDSPENGQVGDLEPALSVLNLLLSTDSIQDELSLLLDKDPLSSLFAFELGTFKPPPPSPPRPPPKPPKPPRDRKAEAERRKQRLLDSAAGFRASDAVYKTRSAHAKLEAFEAEANAPGAAISPISKESSVDGDGDGDALSSTDGRSSKAGKRKKRPPIILPGQADVPPVVEDVNKQDSFKNFDQGWILPSGSRRGGRAPPEKLDLPPPRKKQRTEDRQRSTLSVYGTPASENQTLREIEATPPPPPQQEEEPPIELQGELHEESQGEPREEPQGVSHAELQDMPEVQHKLEETEHTELSLAADMYIEQPTQEVTEVVVTEAPKRSRKEKRPPTVIIEELDTPAIRRAKNMARKRRKEELERQRKAEEAAAVAALAAELTASQPELIGQASDKSEFAEEDSELSSLSSVTNEEDRAEVIKNAGDDDSDYEEGDTSLMVVSAADARKAAQKAGLGPATLRIKESEVLEGGTLGVYLRPPLSPAWERHTDGAPLYVNDLPVWAKAETYPWWPAVVYEEDDPDVPEAIQMEKERVTNNGGGVLLLVRFWDTKRTWQWLPLDKLKLLGEDKDVDATMLNGNSKVQRFKTTKVKEQCRNAWREAMSEMEDAKSDAQSVVQSKPTATPSTVQLGADMEVDQPHV